MTVGHLTVINHEPARRVSVSEKGTWADPVRPTRPAGGDLTPVLPWRATRLASAREQWDGPDRGGRAARMGG